MAYKLLGMAQARWRRLRRGILLPLVRAGIVFVDGVQQPRRAYRPTQYVASKAALAFNHALETMAGHMRDGS
jgi:hypothetical protein